MNELKTLFEQYRTSVFEKNTAAFLSIYHSEFIGFDLWGDWLKTRDSWERMVSQWFSSLNAERVDVEFSGIREIVTPEIAMAHAMTRYTALSADGKYLRHLDNRLTWVARKEGGTWKIIHEHTSAPISHETTKAILQRG